MKRHPHRDPVTPELYRAVMDRDRGCTLARLVPEHICRDRWGREHAPTLTGRLTIEHVHDGYGMAGKRAPSDLAHCVAMCYGGNVGVPSKAERELVREYLAGVAQETGP